MPQLPPPVRTAQPLRQDDTLEASPFRPANKAGRKARLSIQGMSGSGKTWTGLSIAHGLSEGRTFAVIDTEAGAASLYAGHRGIQAQVEKASSRYGGNKFAGWKDGTPMQNAMVAAILAYPGHVVCSMRSYTEWVLDGGKPQRVGMRPEQRKGIEYEFDVAVSMDVDNRLEVLKSRCPGLHRRTFERPNGARDIAGPLLAWLNASPAPAQQ